MWLVYFASVLQFLLIAERVLNRIVCLFVLTRRSETKKLADNSVVGVLFSTLLTYLTLPIQMVTIFAQLILSNVYMFMALLFVAGFVIVVNDNAQQFLVNFVNTYNSGIGQTVNAFVQQLSIVDLVFRSFVPLWNGLVWFVTRWVWHVFMPFVNGESAALPAIIESLTLCVGSFGLAVQTWITNLVTCVGGTGGGGMLGANVTVPFTQPGLQCIGDANYLMLDLVTPGTYFVQVLRTTQDVMTSTCAPVMMIVELGMYPLIDFNLHKAIYSLVNFVLHIFVGLPVTTYQRCQYGKRGDFTVVEKRVMCTPDFAVSNALLVTFHESLGRVLDNWLNVALALVEGAFFGEVTRCVTHSPVKSLSLNASTFLSSGLENFKVVGMTHQMIAVTDGLTTAYHTLTDTQYTEWAIGNWPFRINPQYGVAAVKHGETYDGDVDGDLRTGLFGCECYDVPTGSIGLTRMEVWCASVPYTQFTDNETAYNASTIHRTNFYSSRTAGYMTCAKTRIKVSSMRFSRKRFSAVHFGGVEGGFLDPYNTLGLNGRVEPRSFAADAAVHVQPMCDNTDASCVPDIENCFPWCMGLHMAGMTASNITLYNARTWEETVSVGQIDCVVNIGQLQQCDGRDGTQVISPDFGLDQPGPCFSDDPLCMPDDNSQTLIRLEALANNSLVQHKQSVHPVVRSSKQPFVIAGDVMLHISDCRLVVSRLYDDNKGQFTLDREMLTMSSNWNSPIIHFDDPTQKECMEDFSCNTESDPTCYSQAVKDGRFVLPRSYFATTPVETPVAASEWAVHWAVNPENSVFQAQFEWCNRGARLSGAIVPTSYARPRIWTMKTVRAVDTVNFGIQDTSSMSYMVVPDWLEWREDPETVDCHNMVNLKVLDLEYINENNILVTVLTAPPSSYNHNTDGWPICEGCPYEFTYYYLHPTRQDCIEPSESTEQHFSCWRRESEGMFVATESAVSSVVGELCPQMQRMPELGAASAALASASARALKMVVDLIAVAPAAMGDFASIFQTRLQRITFHSVLDSSGSSLFNIEPVINDIERASMLAAHTLPKLGHFFQGTAEYEYMQPVLLGTAKILQHSATPLNGVLLSQFNMLSKFPATSALNGRRLLQRTVQTGRRGSPQQATSWKRRGANMIVSVIRGTMSAFANSLKAMGRGTKRVIHKVLTSSLSLRTNLLLRNFARQQIQNQVRATVVSGRVIQAVLPVAAVTSADTLLFSTVYESQHDIRRTFTDNVRTQCHGLAQIFGTGTPWGDVAKHSCMLIADSSESILQAFMVVTMDYLVTDCVCKSTEEGNVLEVIESRCLPKFLPISLRAWVLDRLRDETNDVLSHCFVVMDAANERLERAFDPMFRRFELIAPAMARSVDYAMKLFDVDAGNCDKFTLNPYVVTIIPEPTNWFMGCADTNMCKMRCFDTYTAFEEALASQSVKPSLDQEVEVVVESRFFKESDIENGLHRPAFDLYGMTELPSSVCQTVCASTHTLNRCIGITGLERDTEAKRLRTGYYCVPANFMLPMFEYSITQNAELFTEYNDSVLQSYEIMHVEFVTHDGVTRGERDDILVTARNPLDNVMVMWLFPASGEPFEVFRTIVQTDIISEDVPQINTLHEVRVVPATDEDAARVFVIGGKIRADDTVQDVCLMFPFYPSVRHEAMRVDTALHNMENCTEHLDDIYSAEYKFVCVGEDCSRVLKIPYKGTEDSLIEEFEWNRFYLNRVPQTTHYHTADASVVNSISNVFNIQPDYRLSSLLNGERILNDKFVSAYCPKGMQTDTTGVESVSILIADRLTDRQWLHNAQITLPADTYGATLASSIPVPQTLRYMDECSVDNCMACQVPSRPHLYRDVQHKCYAAAQCAMQNCVGLEVNMRKPLCNIGKILAGQIHAASTSGQAAWMALSHTIITVMEITHKRREQYSVLWPQETFVMGVCNMKDDIIATMATLTSTVTWFVDLNSPVKVTDDDEVLDPRANGLHTMLMMSVTELSTAVGLFPVYIAIALENSFQCQYSNLMVVIEQNRQIIAGPDTTGFDLTITNWETRERSSEVAGVCMLEFSRGRMADIAKGSNKDSAALVAKSVLSSVMDITMSSQFDPIMSLLSSMLTYLEGIANGFLKVLQVYDWNDCKLDVISIEHKALCVCGDKAARIPQHQRQALDPTGTPGLNPNYTPVRPHALWCMGPLMLTAVDGSDVLVWNPYTFDQLLAEEHSRYLECRTSWIHMSVFEITNKAIELTSQDIRDVVSETTYEQLLRDYASLNLPSKLQTITHHVFQYKRLSNRCSLRPDSDVTWEVVEDPGDFAADVGARRRLLFAAVTIHWDGGTNKYSSFDFGVLDDVSAPVGFLPIDGVFDFNVYSKDSCNEEKYDDKTASQHLSLAEDLFTATVLNEIKYGASYDTQLRIANLVVQEFDKQREAVVDSVQKELDAIDAQNRQYEIDYKNVGYQSCNVDADCEYTGCYTDKISRTECLFNKCGSWPKQNVIEEIFTSLVASDFKLCPAKTFNAAPYFEYDPVEVNGAFTDYFKQLISDITVLLNQVSVTTISTAIQNKCSNLKVEMPLLTGQGVETMQVITRCRSNYQQKKWDEGSLLFGLFTEAEWQDALPAWGGTPDLAVGMPTMQRYYNKFKRISEIPGMDVSVDMDSSTHQCLYYSLQSQTWGHDCLRRYLVSSPYGQKYEMTQADAYFMYEPHISTTTPSFTSVDACQTYSGNMTEYESEFNNSYLKFVWSGDSTNMVPVATMHTMSTGEQSFREAQALERLEHLLDNTIKPALEKIPANLSDQIEIRAWSVEGDEIHQLVDCVMLGPYSAADMHSTFEMSNAERFPVPQYHRGDPNSRLFVNDGTAETKGSEARQEIMAAAQQHVSKLYDSTITEEAKNTLHQIKTMFRDISNMKCLCPGSEPPSLSCCQNADKLSDINFRLKTLFQDVWAVTNYHNVTMTSLMNSNILRDDLWSTDEFTYASSYVFTDEDKQQLQHHYVFNNSAPIMSYSVDEVPSSFTQETLWSTCMDLLSTPFFTLPVRPTTGNDTSLHVDADMRYDPATETSTGYLHGMERAIEKILERARDDSPVFWTNVHRYVPSDSAWCEDLQASPTPTTTSRANIYTPTTINNITLQPDIIYSQQLNETVFVGHVTSHCLCNWHNGAACVVPKCYEVAVSAELNARWQELCTRGTYTSRADLLLFMQVLDETSVFDTAWLDAPPPPLLRCDALLPSTSWGLLDTKLHGDWYNQTENTQHISIHELATSGPAGLRLGLLSEGPNTLHDFVTKHKLTSRSPDDKMVNYQYQHTIAQPHCHNQRQQFLHTNLSLYFRDVFFPMAHSIHEAPITSYCSTWAIEYAMEQTLKQILPFNDNTLVEQQERTSKWKTRCDVQLQQMGICLLRGVYDIVPNNTSSVPEHCLFTIGDPHGCASSVFYVTPHCLVMCDGQFYAPAQDNDTFTKAGSTPIVDPRTFADHPAVKLYSMHWPSRIEENEVAGEPHLAELNTQALNAELQTIQARLQDVNFEDESLYRNVQHLIELQEVSTDMEGEAPDAYCDDLLDYFDGTVQHPVGYHPTTGCDASTTNMRGFDSWMSKGTQYAWNVDPVRLRNMTKYSSIFGTSHLVCDAGVYGALDYSLNPYFLQTRWDPLQKADPAIPYEPETIDVERMSLFGLPSYDAFDTPIQTEENFMRHSVGLIRDWLRWYGDDPELQAKLDASWPNWVRCSLEEIDCETYGIDTNTAMDQCTLPPLLTCTQDSDCVSGNATHDLVCLQNNHDENNEGICAKRNTCYQHAHCPDDMLCSGAGTCVEPRIFIRNRLDATISAQMFAESNPSCSQSMNGMSQFQNIPDFAHANGMCSFRNWMHYTNLTRDAELQPDGLLHIKNHRKRFSNSDVAQDLYHELNVLRPYVSGCDRSYQHTDYHYCSPHHIPARRGYGEGLEQLCADEDEDNACYMKATKTWMHTADTSSNLTARFCDLYTDYTSHTAFLSPYTYVNEEGNEQDTLEHVPETLKRCYDFEICPTVRFLVEGRGVHKRRVLMVDRDDPNDSSDPFVLQDRMRSYLHSDADECFGVGYHVQGKTLCVVDRYTLPLIDAVFNTDAQLQVEHVPIDTYSSTSNPRWNADYIHDLFVKLREGTGGFAKCPRAFSRVMNGMQHETLFTEFLKVLTRTYKTSAREQVTQYANALLPALFGIDAQTGEGRGLNTIGDYVEHAACMDWISTALQEAKELARRPDEMPYVVESIYPDKTPGTSLYVFHERSAVALNITWFWQCVVLSEAGEDGGVTNQWLEKLTNPTSDEQLECDNFDEDVTDDIRLTMKKRLQTAGGKDGALFKMFEQTTDAGTVDVVADVRQVIQFALNELRLGSTPHVYCMKTYTLRDTQTPWYVNSSCANVFHEAQNQVPPLPSCWEKYGLDLGMVGGQLVDFTDDIDVSITNMAVKAEELLLGSRMAVDQTFAFTLEKLIERGFIKERDQELLDEVDGADDFFPVYFFTYLENDLDPPPVQSFLHDSIASDMFTINNYATLDQNEGSACRGDLSLSDVTVFQLTSPEFEVQDDGFVEATRGYTLQDDNNASLIGRRYLTQDQALFLLMRVIKREIYNTFSFRENNLYLDTFASQLAFPDFGIDMMSQVTAAKEYNDFMAQKSFACSDDQEMLLYAETNIVHKRMRDCVNRLQEDIGWKIDTNEILQLHVPTHVVKSGFYPAYTEHSADKFLDDITSSKWTTEQYVSAQDLVCYKTRTGNAEPLNPLWAGGYDVLTCPQGVSCGCDTTVGIGDTRFVDASCRKRDDEQCSDLFPDFARASIPLSCQTLSAQFQSVTMPRMGSIRADETPLCQRTPSLDATTCSRRFGTLHGNPGFVPGSILYTTPFSRGGVVQRGLWGGSNSIFRGQRHERFLPEITPAIQLLSGDIAGHALEFEIEPNGNLYLRCVSMLPVESQDSSFQERFPSPPSNECTIPSGEWMKNLESSWLWQHNTLKSEWPTQTVTSPSVSWKCPLQRIAAYSNHSKAFSALTPSRDRNKVRFEHITENSHFAHPTVSSIDVMPHLKPARFIADNLACATYDVNGRAFCHGKNLLDFSLNSLLTYTDTWSQFTLVEPSNKCDQMLDWPHQSFTTRDQKTVRSEYTERCNVLHRLPSFGVKATRIENVISKGTSSASTSPGGVCHMQQLPHLQPWSEVCVENKIPCNTQSKNAVQTCMDDGDWLFCRYLFNQEILSESESTFTLLDKIIQIRKLAAYQAKRQPTRRAQRCSQCAANHGTNTSGFQGGFVNRSGANDPLPASPLMSVGMPMRLSTERMLARYLRKIVCPHASEEPCAELLAIFNTDAWTTGQFLRAFMSANDTAGLLKQWDVGKQDTFDHTLFGTNYTDDAALWSRNWVFCDQATTNNAGCNGSISKTEWLDPHARPDACRRAILDSKTTESLPVHFCLLDKNTERLCQYVVEWTDEITSILCKAAGLPECPETDFFYTPTTYAIENREFVSETVLGFYNSIDDSVCAASLTDTEVQAQALSNAIQKQKCDAVPVAVTKSIIQKIHESIRNLYRLIYHAFSATTYFGLTIISMIENVNVGFFFNRFKFHFFMVIQSFFEMIYKFIITILKHIPGTKFLVDAICVILKIMKVAFCGLLRGMEVASEFAETTTSHLNTAREVMWTYSPMGLISTAAGGDDTVGNFMKKGLSQYVIDEMGEEYSGIENIFTIPKVFFRDAADFVCNFDTCPKFDFNENPDNSTLPSPTRCWPSYQTFFGDNQQLSCTAADTCRLSLTSTDTSLGYADADQMVPCGQCTAMSAGFDDYGCDALTKLCTCSVPRYSTTQCLSNDECQASSATCNYIDSEFQLLPTPTDCAVCTSQKVCYMEPGAEIGTCACGLTSIPFSQCLPETQGKVVIPHPDKMCLYETERRFSDMSRSQSTFSHSLSVSCADMNQLSARCLYVTDFRGYFIVNQPGFSGRRLLGMTVEEKDNIDSSITHSPVCRDALHPDNRMALFHAREECIRAYMTSMDTIRTIKMEGKLKPCTFCSVEDFKHEAKNNPMFLVSIAVKPDLWLSISTKHGPGRHIASIYKTAKQLHDVIMKDLRTPSVIKTRLPTNHTTHNTTHTETTANFSHTTPTLNRRRLLTYTDIVNSIQQEFEAATSMHQSFASQFASTYDYSFPDLTDSQQTIWFHDWPPTYDSSSSNCNIFSNTLTLAQWAIGNATLPFTPAGRALQATPASRLRDAWPRINTTNVTVQDDGEEEDILVDWFTWVVRKALSWVSLDSHSLYDLFSAMTSEILSATTCDYQAIQTCSKWYVTLSTGFIVTVVYFSVWFLLCSVFQLTFIAALTMPLFTIVLMWVCYGYSPFCFPLIPVCAMRDLHDSLNMVFPRYMRLPLSLAPNCPDTGIAGGAPLYNNSCVQDCRLPPFEYTSWHAVVAWTTAEFGPDAVQWTLDNTDTIPFIDHDLLRFQLEIKDKMIQDDNYDLVAGNRVCALLSSYQVMPYLLIVVVVFLAFVTVVRTLFLAIAPLTQLVATTYVSIFVQDRREKEHLD